jgi:hypothetical protein
LRNGPNEELLTCIAQELENNLNQTQNFPFSQTKVMKILSGDLIQM